MNKMIVAGFALCVAMSAFADAAAPTNRMTTAEKIRYNSGGVFMPPENGKSVLLIDLRGGEKKESTWKPFLSHQKQMFDLPMTLKYGEPPKPGYDLYRTVKSFKSDEHPAVLMMVDDAEAPGMSVFPEETLAVLNVRPYKTNDETKYSHRLTRELWRTFGLAMGAYANVQQGDVLRVVVEPEDLDRIPTPIISGMRQDGVVRMARRIRIRSNKPVSYYTACREGWAPSPTNDVQRKIWDKIHAVPKNPMKIEFDPKKGE